MKIYFHIGTEKTGSSHLQSIAAINRKRLTEEGIWFPEAGKREGHLLSGKISAGNAQNITDALNEGDFEECSEIISKHLIKAKELRCHTLLLSNELLVLALANEKILKHFKAVLKSNSCSDAKYLLFLRDPVNQALSLFKHRAKSSPGSDIEKWPHQHYYYGTGLLSFFKKADHEKINLTCRKFSKKSGSLEEIFFNQWLGLDIKLTPPPKLVNPSLSLSELLLLKKIRRREPYLANILYERLLAVSKDHKAEQTFIEQYHKNVLSNYLVQFEETWKICNAHLPETERLSLPCNVKNEHLEQEKISSFSDLQMDEISGIIADSLSIRFKLQVEGLKWRRRMGTLIKRLLK